LALKQTKPGVADGGHTRLFSFRDSSRYNEARDVPVQVEQLFWYLY
jgi:hypothetical protein